ncbi:DUF1003 domain-containing protein [Candidatus Giovannonibacteria bacterium]|nr:DUF1003 domain-containing protein [Candidatus Giovannonibacteria bacterium]
MTRKVFSLEELKNLRPPVRNIAREHHAGLSALERFAVYVTNHIGTMGFFLIILFWTVFWIGWNLFSPEDFRFDPFPAFVLWLFISNLIQLMLLPLIMIGQNLQGKYSQLRSEHEYEINMKAEREIEAILLHLENHEEILQKISEKIEK